MPAGAKILSFRAGKMNMSGTTVTADPTKGSIELYRDADQMMCFVWRNRATNAVSPNDEFVVVQGDYTWKRVHQCKSALSFPALPCISCAYTRCSTGRVFLLSFYGEKRFFWMQEPNADKDAEYACSLTWAQCFAWHFGTFLTFLQNMCQFAARDWGYLCSG